jgi:hypothetical protein
VLDLVGAQERIVDPLDDVGYRVGRVQRLIGVHRAGEVGVRGDLPSGDVDGAQAGAGLLDCLVAGERAERARGVVAVVEQGPQTLGAAPRESVLDAHAGPELLDVSRSIGTLDTWKTIGLGRHRSISLRRL